MKLIMAELLRFAGFELDRDAFELRRNGQRIDIEPKAFELLKLLAERPDHAFSKDEIAAALWPDRVISDTVIAQCVRKARQACGDSAGQQKVIRTVHRVGYRFAARLTERTPPEHVSPAAPPLLEHSRAQGMAWLLAGGLLLAVFAWLVLFEPPESAPERIIIASLPPADTSETGLQLTAGLESLLAREMAHHSRVELLSARRVGALFDSLGLSTDDEPERLLNALHDALGADFIMRAKLHEHDSDGQLLAELTGLDGQVVRLESERGDLATLVRGFSRSLADQVRGAWAETDGLPLLSDDDFVNRALVRGLDALLAGDNATAALLFESTLSMDPGLTTARYELANAHWQMGNTDVARQGYLDVLDELSGHSPSRLEAHAGNMLGVLAWQAGDLDQAQSRLEQALEIYGRIDDPHGAASALGNLGILADIRGDLSQAAELLLRAKSSFQQARDQVGESAVYTNLAVLARLRSRLHEAANLQQQAIDIQRRLGIGSMLARSLTYAAEIATELGQLDRAAALLVEAESMAMDQSNPNARAEVNLARARLHRLLWQFDPAFQQAEQARDRHRELGQPAGEILALTELAQLEFTLGRSDAALEYLAAAEQLDKNISKPRDRQQRQLLKAQCLTVQSRLDEADHLLAGLLESRDTLIKAGGLAVQARRWWQQGQAMRALSDWQLALDQLEQIDEPRQRTLLMLEIANAHSDSGQPEAAEHWLTLAAAWNDRLPDLLAARVRWLLARGEVDRARNEFEALSNCCGTGTTALATLHNRLAGPDL